MDDAVGSLEVAVGGLSVSVRVALGTKGSAELLESGVHQVQMMKCKGRENKDTCGGEEAFALNVPCFPFFFTAAWSGKVAARPKG